MPDVALLKWLQKATKEEMMDLAQTTESIDDAIVILEHVTLGSECSPEMEAIADLRRTQLLVGLDEDYGKYKLKSAVDNATKLLDANNPDLLSAKKLLERVLPADPDEMLLTDHIDQIVSFHISISDDEEDADEKLKRLVSPEWLTVFTVSTFNAHVQSEGMQGYFANTLGANKETILNAFKEVSKKTLISVERAFDIFEENSRAHRKSSMSKGAEVQLYAIKPAREMPGYISGDEADDPYELVEDEYMSAADKLDSQLIKFIKKNRDKLPRLESLAKNPN